MKVGISTFHFVHNNGAMLQCWALQEKLNEMGHETIVINYRPKYHVSQYSAWRNPFFVKGVNNKLKTFVLNYRYFERKRKELKFSEFEKNFILSDEVNNNTEWEKIHPNTMDAIICGSDQIWNEKLTNGKFDFAYFAKIDGFTGKKIAYAVSVGETKLKDRKEELFNLIKDFKAISTRERQTEKELKELFPFLNITTVPDPTLLIERTKYEKIMVDLVLPHNYILVYSLENNEQLIELCNSLVLSTGLEIINISPTRIVGIPNIIWKADVTPGEFITYISKASYVVTNSFHGSVFSLLFNKKVAIVPHSKRNDRLKNLVEVLEADCCMLDDSNMHEVLEFNIDYNKINERIIHYRTIGELFINKALLE